MANEWELSKENVQPLKQGRKFSSLSAALQTSANDHHLRKEKQEFEAELRTYDGDDPLDVWYRYIKWTEQSHPKGGKNSNLTPIIERCLSNFKDNDRYKNDPRYVEAWILYANLCIEPQDIFSFMYDQNVGHGNAYFYEAWAWSFEQVGNTKRANSIYQEGIKNRAEPFDVLERKHVEFQKRVARGLMTEPDDDMTTGMEEQRTALGHLKTSGKQHKVGVNRTGDAKQGSRGGLGLKLNKGQVGQSFQVFNDENQDPSQLPSQKGQWSQTPKTAVLNKENDQKPGVWTKAKVPQRGISVPIHQLSSHSKPSFTVHVEENADQSMMTPRKLPDLGNQVLSAHKSVKAVDPLQRLREQEETDPDLKPMYCKHLINCGAEEYQFEELRAARWKEKKRKEEEQRMIEEEERVLEERREQLRKTREMILVQEEQFKQQQLQLNKEQEAMIAQYRQQLKQQHEQFEKERLMQIQIQQEMLEKDIQNRLKQQASNDIGSTSSDVHHTSTLQPLHQKNSQRLNQSLNNSNRTPSTHISFNESRSTGKLSQPSTDPTPNSSYTRSLTAPSPTVCTKEAMQLVRGMFNASLTIDKHVEDEEMPLSSNTSGVEAFRAEGGSGSNIPFGNAGVGGAVPFGSSAGGGNDMPFTIYDENSGPPKQITPKTYNTENDENMPPQDLPTAPKRKGLGGILKHTNSIEMTRDPVFSAMDFQDDDTERLEGIESQARDDFTIAPVCSHRSFAEAARFASTPFHKNVSLGTLPDVSQINRLDHTDKENHGNLIDSKVSITHPTLDSVTNEDEKNLSPIMEGSNEDSSGHNTHTAASIISNHSSVQPRHMIQQPPVGGIQEEEEELHMLDQTHVIDVTTYIPTTPDSDDRAAEASILIDPHNPFDDDQIEMFLSDLPEPLHTHPNYTSVDGQIDVKEDFIATFGYDVYTVIKMIGKGGYAKVYSAMLLDIDSDPEDMTTKALKIQSPPCQWEFYICNELQNRLTLLNDPVDVRPAMMSVEKAYIYEDASCLVTDCHNNGTLLDLVNSMMTKKIAVEEWLAVYVTIELLHMVDKLHKCQIIHGDFKPDNMMLLGLPSLPDSCDPSVVFNGNKRLLQLIDFGQSIDMTKYPPGTTFMAKVKTSDFQCIEMKTDRPWTYQTDLFGLAGTIHVVLFGQYMKVYQESGVWRTTSAISRSWNSRLWKELFNTLLNVPSCSELPDLGVFITEFEQYFVKNLLKDYRKKNSQIAMQCMGV